MDEMGLPVVDQSVDQPLVAPSEDHVDANALLADPTTLLLLQLCFDETEFGPTTAAPDTGANAGCTKAVAAASDATAFDALGFVAAKLRHVPLDVLKRDLERYAAHLRAGVLKTVQDEVYETFVDVSSQLVGLGQAARRVEQPLAAMHFKVTEAGATLTAAADGADAYVNLATIHDVRRRFYTDAARSAVLLRQSGDDVAVLMDAVGTYPASRADAASSPAETTGAGGATAGGSASVSLFGAEIVALMHRAAVSSLQANIGVDRLAAALRAVRMVRNSLASSDSPPSTGAAPQPVLQASVTVRDSPDAAGGAGLVADDDDAVMQSELDMVKAATDEQLTSLVELLVETFDVALSRTAASATETRCRSHEVMASAVAALVTVGHADRVVEAVRQKVAAPVADRVLTWQATLAAKSSVLADGEAKSGLEELTNQLVEELCVSTRCVASLQASVVAAAKVKLADAGDHDPPLSTIYTVAPPLIATAVWPALAEAITKRMGWLFTSGRPAAFRAQVESATRIIAAVEAACADATELHILRGSRDMAAWQRRWNFDVYVALRVEEATAKIEIAVQLPWNSDDAAGGLSPAATSMLNGALWLISSEVAVFPALQRILRASVSTFRAGIDAAVSAVRKANSAEVFVPAAAMAAASGMQLLSERCSVSVILAIQDAFARFKASSHAPDIAAAVARSFVAAAEKGAQTLNNVVIEALAESVIERMNNIKTVRTAFSMTKKPMPTGASSYTAGVFEPLVTHLDAMNLSAGDRQHVGQQVVDLCWTKAESIVREVVAAARRTQESFDKLRRKKTGEVSQKPTIDTASDFDKISAQLHLDVQEVVRFAKAAGFPSDPPSSLNDATSRGQWACGGFNGEEPVE